MTTSPNADADVPNPTPNPAPLLAGWSFPRGRQCGLASVGRVSLCVRRRGKNVPGYERNYEWTATVRGSGWFGDVEPAEDYQVTKRGHAATEHEACLRAEAQVGLVRATALAAATTDAERAKIRAGWHPREELAAIDAQIEALEARRRALYRESVAAPDADKLADDRLAEMLGEESMFGRLGYPFSVTGIVHHPDAPVHAARRGLRYVAVRPVAAECQGKTYLGVYLGEIATQACMSVNRHTGVVELRVGMHNPAIFVPDLGRVVYGYESWWGRVESPEQLRKITDGDIEGLWYVQAAKAIFGGGAAAPAAPGADAGEGAPDAG